MFAYVKDGNVIAVSESRMTKKNEPEFVRQEVTEEKDGETVVTGVLEYWTPSVPGLVFDEEIETDIEGELEYANGAVRKVEKPEPIAETVPEPIVETQVAETEETGTEEIPAVAE